jgi:hypothetical protein
MTTQADFWMPLVIAAGPNPEAESAPAGTPAGPRGSVEVVEARPRFFGSAARRALRCEPERPATATGGAAR